MFELAYLEFNFQTLVISQRASSEYYIRGDFILRKEIIQQNIFSNLTKMLKELVFVKTENKRKNWKIFLLVFKFFFPSWILLR